MSTPRILSDAIESIRNEAQRTSREEPFIAVGLLRAIDIINKVAKETKDEKRI